MYLLAILMSWSCPAFWWGDSNATIHWRSVLAMLTKCNETDLPNQ
jgi:hypothetical protein